MAIQDSNLAEKLQEIIARARADARALGIAKLDVFDDSVMEALEGAEDSLDEAARKLSALF